MNQANTEARAEYEAAVTRAIKLSPEDRGALFAYLTGWMENHPESMEPLAEGINTGIESLKLGGAR